MQELWVVWVAGALLFSLSVVGQIMMRHLERRERTTVQPLDPVGIFDSAGEPKLLNILVGMLRVMGIFFLAVGVTVSVIAAVLHG